MRNPVRGAPLLLAALALSQAPLCGSAGPSAVRAPDRHRHPKEGSPGGARGGGGRGPRVFAFGGARSAQLHSSVVESFSPEDGRWANEEPMTRVRAGCGGVSVGGKLWAIGGHDNRLCAMDDLFERRIRNGEEPGLEGDEHVIPTLDSTEYWDPHSSKGWIAGPEMLRRRTSFATAVCNGRIYVFGGTDGSSFLNSAESLDPRENVWRREPTMPTCRTGCAAATVGDDIYVMGGFDGESPLSTCSIFDTRLGVWKGAPNLLNPRSGAAAAVIRSTIYLFGGVGKEDYLSGVDMFKVSKGAWQRDITDRMQVPRTTPAAVAVGNVVYIMGGFDGETFHDSVEMYEPGVGFSPVKKMSVGRCLLAAAVL